MFRLVLAAVNTKVVTLRLNAPVLFSLVALWLLIVCSTSRAQLNDACARQDDCFVDLSGKPRSASRAYEDLHRIRERHYVRALIEETLALGVGATWYWVQKDENAKDWDLPPLSARLTTNVLRFDSNTFPINFLWHPLSGGGYYVIPRSNDMGLGLSMLSAVLASTAWEYGLEFREKVSINDLIATPIAGIAIGEPVFRMASYLNRPVRRVRPGQRVAAYTLAPLTSLHNYLDEVPMAQGPEDNLGYLADIFHRFDLHAGVGTYHTREESGLIASMEGEMQFVAVPSYLRPGRFRRFLRDADFSRLRLSVLAGPDGAYYDLFADTILASFIYQDIAPTYHGTSLAVGSALGFHQRKVGLADFVDELGITHLPGLALELSRVLPRALLHASARFGIDFVGARSWAFEAWDRDNPDEITKPTLERYAYAYGFGPSARVTLEANLPRLRLGLRTFLALYDSVEGLGRAQEKQTRDPHSEEVVIDGEGYARIFPFSGLGIHLELSVALHSRVSHLGGYERRGRLLASAASFGFTF